MCRSVVQALIIRIFCDLFISFIHQLSLQLVFSLNCLQHQRHLDILNYNFHLHSICKTTTNLFFLENTCTFYIPLKNSEQFHNCKQVLSMYLDLYHSLHIRIWSQKGQWTFKQTFQSLTPQILIKCDLDCYCF